MNNGRRGVRLYVRNRSKYNPVTPDGDLMYVDVADYANTYVWMLKEQCKKRGPAKLDELFYFTEPSADYPDGMVRLEEGRTVAHYNLQNGTIIETTSNPFFAACMYILHEEACNKIEANLNDRKTKEIMTKSKIHKLTIVQVLFNSQKDDGDTQPRYFSRVEDFVTFVHAHPKKGVEMSHFTESALYRMYTEFVDKDLGKADPIRSFVNRYAERLGCRNGGDRGHVPGQDDEDGRRGGGGLRGIRRAGGIRGGYRGNRGGRGGGRARANGNQGGKGNRAADKGAACDRVCENCEETEAAVYCAECEGAQALCDECSTVLHRAAARRQHRILDIAQAPKKKKAYIPKPYRAPFAMLLALYHGHTSAEPLLSMTEDELKIRAQAVTDTDLSARSPGKRFGGFEGIEQLLTKNLIRREAAAHPTYALMEDGLRLGEKLMAYHLAFNWFCGESGLPQLPHYGPDNLVVGNQRICLLIDIYEKQRQRFVDIAKKQGVCAQIRELKVCDYMWILAPAGADENYQEVLPDEELVLPQIVERKTWDDLEASADSNRFRSQINRMKRSGMQDLFYLVEGSVRDMRNKDEHQREYLQELLEELQLVEGFHLVQTFAWLRSANWLLTLTHLAAEKHRAGLNGPLLTMTEVVTVATGRRPPHRPQDMMAKERHVHIWTATEMAEKIFKDALEGQPLIDAARDMMGIRRMRRVTDEKEHLLIIQDLEVYLKTRDQHMNRSLATVCSGNMAREPKDVVADQLEPYIREILHPDVFHYWIAAMQLHLGIKVMKCEDVEEVALLQMAFMNARHPLQGQRLMTHYAGDDGDDGGGGGRVVATVTAAHHDDIILDGMDEDAELRLALQASLREYQQFSNEYKDIAAGIGAAWPPAGGMRRGPRKQRVASVDRPGGDAVPVDRPEGPPTVQLSEEEQLRMALELSMSEHKVPAISSDEAGGAGAGMSEEEQLKHVLALSLQERSDQTTSAKSPRKTPSKQSKPPLSCRTPDVQRERGATTTPNKPIGTAAPTPRTPQSLPATSDQHGSLTPRTPQSPQPQRRIDGARVHATPILATPGTSRNQPAHSDRHRSPSPSSQDEKSSEDEDLKRALELSLQDEKRVVSSDAVKSSSLAAAADLPSIAAVLPSPRRALKRQQVAACTQQESDMGAVGDAEKDKVDSSDDEDLKRALELSLQNAINSTSSPRQPSPRSADTTPDSSPVFGRRAAPVERTSTPVAARKRLDPIPSTSGIHDQNPRELGAEDSSPPVTACEKTADPLPSTSGIHVKHSHGGKCTSDSDEDDGLKRALELSLRERLDSSSAAVAAQILPVLNTAASPDVSQQDSEPTDHEYIDYGASPPDLDLPDDASQSDDDDDDDALPVPLTVGRSPASSAAMKDKPDAVSTFTASTPAKQLESDEALAWRLASKVSPVNVSKDDEDLARRLQDKDSQEEASQSILAPPPPPPPPQQVETDEELARKLQRELSGDVSDGKDDAGLAWRLQQRDAPAAGQLTSDEQLARRLQNEDEVVISGTEQSDAELARRLQEELNPATTQPAATSTIAKSPESQRQNDALMNHFATEFARKRKTPSKSPGLFDDLKKAKLDQTKQLTDYRDIQRKRHRGNRWSPAGLSARGGTSDLRNLSLPADIWTAPPRFPVPVSPVGRHPAAARFTSPVGIGRSHTTTPLSNARTSTPTASIPTARFTGGRVETTNHAVNRRIFDAGDSQTRTAVVPPHRTAPAALGAPSASKQDVLVIDDDLPDIKPLGSVPSRSSASCPKHELEEDVKTVSGESASGETLCNVTCGACGGRGHSRTYKHCPKYYTAVEVQRRNEHAETRRKKSEAQKQEKAERLQLLEHQREALQKTFDEQKEVLNKVIQSLGGKKPPKSPKRKKRN